MTNGILRAIVLGWALALASGSTVLAATDLSGAWQGNWQNGARVIPRVVTIQKAAGGFYHARMFNLGEADGHGPLDADPISDFHPAGNHVSFRMDSIGGLFDGTLSKDGKALTGTWAEWGGKPGPMNLTRAAAKDAWVIDPSPHTIRMVTVDKDVSLQVLDWGGSGPALIFLAGQGDTAHIFDKFAPTFTARHHVYGITRRGYGLSSTPPPTDANYDSDRLGDDVLAVIDALKLDRPVIAGHSLSGTELSSIGSRHPEKVSGLIYLDATYGYAFYEPGPSPLPHGNDFSIVHNDLARIQFAGPAETQTLAAEILATLPELQRDVQAIADQKKGQPEGTPPFVSPHVLTGRAIAVNGHKYVTVKAPMLAIIAVPHDFVSTCNVSPCKEEPVWGNALADAIQADNPTARIVRLPYAKHEVWNSNEAGVTREMNVFMDGLVKR